MLSILCCVQGFEHVINRGKEFFDAPDQYNPVQASAMQQKAIHKGKEYAPTAPERQRYAKSGGEIKM